MIGHALGGILRQPSRFARTAGKRLVATWLLLAVLAGALAAPAHGANTAESATSESSIQTPKMAGDSVVWNFGRNDDPLFQGVPQGWNRFEGRGFPKYVRIGIKAKDLSLEQSLTRFDASTLKWWQDNREALPDVPLPPPITDWLVDRYLCVELDGGQVRFESPLTPVNTRLQYQLSCQIQTRGLKHDVARAELVFLDRQEEELAVHSTASIGGTKDWSSFKSERAEPPSRATHVRVRLLVERGTDGLEDVRGQIGFDDIQVLSFPQLHLWTDQSQGVHQIGQKIIASARALGWSSSTSAMQFRLLDANDQLIASELIPIASTPATVQAGTKTPPANDVTSAQWSLPSLDAGFFRIEASLAGDDIQEHWRDSLRADTTFVVIEPTERESNLRKSTTTGIFGWTLPDGNQGTGNQVTGPRELARWLTDLGVAWVKYPCWTSSRDSAVADETADVIRQLQESGINVIGMLDRPRGDLRLNQAEESHSDQALPADKVFQDRQSWQPQLESTMSRFSLNVRTWQLGAERDYSFLGRPQLISAIQQIAVDLQELGEPVEVAISMPWMDRESPTRNVSWQAVCRSSDPPLAASELDAALTAHATDSGPTGPRTWLLLDPIPVDQGVQEARIRDLVLRMATARTHAVQAAFVSDPHDPKHGLLRADGRPDAMLLPWRTTARLIGNCRSAGSLPLRSGAENRIFIEPGGEHTHNAVLLLWAPEPTEEYIYLGENARLVDVWGRVSEPETDVKYHQKVQRIPIGPLPSFVIGVDPKLLAFRMSVELQPNRLDSYLGQQQRMLLRFTNPTDQLLTGKWRVLPPENWQCEMPEQLWELAPGQTVEQPMEIVLGNSSRVGEYDVPILFQLDTDPPQSITVLKQVTVGPENLEVLVTTGLMPNGYLRVRIEMTNKSERSRSYDCAVFPTAGRQYERCWLTVSPGQTARRELTWREGRELIGTQMILRADDHEEGHVFNHAFTVAP